MCVHACACLLACMSAHLESDSVVMRGDVREEAGTDVLSLGIFSRSDQPLVSSGQIPRPLRTTAQQHMIRSQFICITHLMCFLKRSPTQVKTNSRKAKAAKKRAIWSGCFSHLQSNMWNLWDDKNVNLKCQHWKMHISMRVCFADIMKLFQLVKVDSNAICWSTRFSRCR